MKPRGGIWKRTNGEVRWVPGCPTCATLRKRRVAQHIASARVERWRWKVEWLSLLFDTLTC